jgi:hypothetical protein
MGWVVIASVSEAIKGDEGPRRWLWIAASLLAMTIPFLT